VLLPEVQREGQHRQGIRIEDLPALKPLPNQRVPDLQDGAARTRNLPACSGEE